MSDHPTTAAGCPHWFQRHPCDICMKDNTEYAKKFAPLPLVSVDQEQSDTASSEPFKIRLARKVIARRVDDGRESSEAELLATEVMRLRHENKELKDTLDDIYYRKS